MKRIIKNITFPAISWRDGYRGLQRELRKLEESQYLPLEKHRELQLLKLKLLLKHAYKNVPFYRKRFDECGFNPFKMQDFDELVNIPVLSKDDVRGNLNEMVACNFGPGSIHSSITGGTTGSSLKFYRDNKCLTKKEAALLRFEKWTGWDIGEWRWIVWPATIDHKSEWTFRAKVKNYLSTRNVDWHLTTISEKCIIKQMKRAEKQSISMIRAFPMPLAEVAKHISSNCKYCFSVKGIITTGEPLHANQRDLIEKAFRSKVFDSYRTREIGPIAQECRLHNGYHINCEGVYLEIIPFEKSRLNDGNNKKQHGRIVVTDLLNYGMPFIRYDIGDIGMISNRKCECGLGLPLIEDIGGRLVDMVYTSDKRKIASITLIPSLVVEPGILNSKVQFVQDAFDHIIIRISKPKPSNEALEKQKESVLRIFGSRMKISHEFVDDIPSLKSGKYAFIICKIPEKEISKL